MISSVFSSVSSVKGNRLIVACSSSSARSISAFALSARFIHAEATPVRSPSARVRFIISMPFSSNAR